MSDESGAGHIKALNDGEDRYSFNFRTAELHLEGVHWSNLNSFTKTESAGLLSVIMCPRKTPCRIYIGKTHVRVTYATRDGKRYATNIVPLDPE